MKAFKSSLIWIIGRTDIVKIIGIQLFLLLLSTPILFSQEIEFAQEAVKKIEAQLAPIRHERADLIIPRGWPLKATIHEIESSFKNPFQVHLKGTERLDKVEDATTLKDLYEVGYSVLKSTAPTQKAPPMQPRTIPPFSSNHPAHWRPLLSELYLSLVHARSDLNRSVNSISEQAREDLLSLYEWPQKGTGLVVQEISSKRVKRKYQAMEKFDDQSLLRAGRTVFNGLSKFQEDLEPLRSRVENDSFSWSTPIGTFLVRSKDNHTTEEDQLKDVIVLIDLGGDNTYTTPVANAMPNEIKLAIDYGESVTIESQKDTGPNAGAGIFGIGILVLPNAEGKKKIHIHSYGQGSGLGGIGAMHINGTAEIKGVRYVQGAGLWGVGLYLAQEAHQSSYWAERNGQGLGLTRGVGIFAHHGNESKILGGLVEPDPREPAGSVSLCQGVGSGRRAYVGGGMGIAFINGDKNLVKASYFSQGAGYWHAMGLFRYRGNESHIQARRYDMGSGIHAAFGHFQLFGDRNRILNWGVGPSYGWDRGLGSSLIRGSYNEFKSTWGSGMASIDSLSLSYFEGDHNKIHLPQFGLGRYYRRRLAYSVQVMEGKNNLFQYPPVDMEIPHFNRFLFNPWGLFVTTPITLVPELNLEPPKEERLPREQTVKREKLDLQSKIKTALTKKPAAQISDLVDISAAFSLDKESPRDAFKELMQIPPENLSGLIEALEPASIEQMIYLRVVMAAYGKDIAKIIQEKFNEFETKKRMTLLTQLAYHPPTETIPFLLEFIQNEDSSSEATLFRVNAVGTVGLQLNKDTGQDPGFYAVLVSLKKSLSTLLKNDISDSKELLGRLRPWESYGLLSSLLPNTEQTRLDFFSALPEDITNTITEPGANAVFSLLKADRKGALSQIDTHLMLLDQTEVTLRESSVQLLKSTHTNEAGVAIKALGQIGHPDDLEHLKPFLNHSKGKLRELTAISMGQMGKPAIPFLKKTMKSGSPRERQMVMASLPHSVSWQAYPLLKMGIVDSDPLVRLNALSVVQALSPSFRPHKQKILKYVKSKSRREKNPEIKVMMKIVR